MRSILKDTVEKAQSGDLEVFGWLIERFQDTVQV